MGNTSTYCWEEDLVSLSHLLSLFDPNETLIQELSVNWYQRNYPFAWIGARLVRDL
jgi:hypothetical protein